MKWLIDDQHLSQVLRTGRRPPGVRKGDEIFTTGYWYLRLCQAALGAADRSGVLSRAFAQLPEEMRRRALGRVAELPAEVGLLSLRSLAPVIGRLRRSHDLNVIASEALAASAELDARVLLSVASPRLEAALTAEGRRGIVRPPRRGG